MPNTRIEVRRSWSADQQAAIIDAVHEAMIEAIKIPAHDKLIRYVEHRPEHFIVPPGCTENYTLVEITLFSGRSLDAKRALYQGIVRRLGTLGIAPTDVRIVLFEVPADNWGIRGGIPASEVNIGFKIDV